MVVRRASGDRARAIVCIEIGEHSGKTVEGTADDADVVWVQEIHCQRSCVRKALEVLGENLAAATTTFAMLDGVEEGFQGIVGSVDEPDAPACRLGKGNDMPPEMRPMTINALSTLAPQVRQDQVDGLMHVFSRTSVGTPLPE